MTFFYPALTLPGQKNIAVQGPKIDVIYSPCTIETPQGGPSNAAISPLSLARGSQSFLSFRLPSSHTHTHTDYYKQVTFYPRGEMEASCGSSEEEKKTSKRSFEREKLFFLTKQGRREEFPPFPLGVAMLAAPLLSSPFSLLPPMSLLVVARRIPSRSFGKQKMWVCEICCCKLGGSGFLLEVSAPTTSMAPPTRFLSRDRGRNVDKKEL